VQPVEPLLDFKRFDVLGNLTAAFRDKDVANVVLKDGLGVLRLCVSQSGATASLRL